MMSINDLLPKPKKQTEDKTKPIERPSPGSSLAVTGDKILDETSRAATSVVPLRNRAEVALERPNPETAAETADRTQQAIDAILEKRISSAKPKKIGATGSGPQFVQYTPADPLNTGSGETRTLKIVDVQYDPFEPARHKHVKAPARPASPPAPILKDAPKRLSAEEHKAWHIPPSVSNWKNPKGYVIDLDKRMAADGRTQVESPSVNDRQIKMAEALFDAEALARQAVDKRAQETQAREDAALAHKEQRLRALAQKARQSRPREEAAARERQAARSAREDEDALSRKRDVSRDISEQVALGGTPSTSTEAQFDTRLYAKASRPSNKLYDEPLFAGQQAVREIYRPRGTEEGSGPIEFEKE